MHQKFSKLFLNKNPFRDYISNSNVFSAQVTWPAGSMRTPIRTLRKEMTWRTTEGLWSQGMRSLTKCLELVAPPKATGKSRIEKNSTCVTRKFICIVLSFTRINTSFIKTLVYNPRISIQNVWDSDSLCALNLIHKKSWYIRLIGNVA